MTDFAGFQDSDFRTSIDGTRWRAELAAALSSRCKPDDNRAWGGESIRRKQYVFFYPEGHFGGALNRQNGVPRCKFAVQLDADGMHVGLYVERGYGAGTPGVENHEILDDNWDWHRLVGVLKSPGPNAGLDDTLTQQGLSVRAVLYEGNRVVSTRVLRARENPSDKGLRRWQVVENGIGMEITWEAFVDVLLTTPDHQWIDLFVERFVPKEQALAAGSAVFQTICETFAKLLPIFDSVAGYHSSPKEGKMLQAVKETTAPLQATPRPTVADLVSHLQATKRLHFSPYQVAAYLTALQSKGFVILSGISGTGKTKLAQGLASLLQVEGDARNTIFLPVRPDWRDSKSLLGYYNPLSGKYASTELVRFILEAREERQAPSQPPMEDSVRWQLTQPENVSWLTGFRQLRDQIKGKSAEQLTTEDLDLLWRRPRNGVASIGSAVSTALLADETLLRQATAIVMDVAGRTPGQRYLEAIAVLGPAHHWARVWRAVAAFDPEHVHAIVNGSFVQELLRYLEYDEPANPHDLARRGDVEAINQQTEFIMKSARKLWTQPDGMLEVAIIPMLMLEYYRGKIAPTTTPTSSVVAAEAAQPFFILLDEMNLARVEHYFAEFLSVLESGRGTTGFTEENLPLHSGTKVEDEDGRRIPDSLALPPNLYFVGTVNVDETTHAFSPKVLDRAFTIEFEAADLKSYPQPTTAVSAALDEPARLAFREAFTRGGRFARIDKEQIAAWELTHGEFMPRLRDLEQQLRPYDFHFAYRTVDEILMYLMNAEAYGWFEGLGGLPCAFDSAVLMKVLPKMHGPRAQLEKPLQGVLKWAGLPAEFAELLASQHQDYPAAITRVRAWLEAASPDFTRFPCPRVALKCLRMLHQLHTTGFASFG